MSISLPLVSKGLVGVLAIAAPIATGVYYKDEISSVLFGRSLITKWDGYILEAIEKNESTFNFSLYSDEAGNTQLSNFPEFSDVTESGTTTSKQKATVVVKIEADTQQTDDSREIKQKNGGTKWTWKCKIDFIRPKENSTTKDMKDTDKNAIYQSSIGGLLWKITQANNKKEKLKIVKLCAEARGEEKNKELEKLSNLNKENSNTISSSKSFQLTNDGDKLKFEENEFDKWFGTDSK